MLKQVDSFQIFTTLRYSGKVNWLLQKCTDNEKPKYKPQATKQIEDSAPNSKPGNPTNVAQFI